MSALPLQADMAKPCCDVHFVPKADVVQCSERRRYSQLTLVQPNAAFTRSRVSGSSRMRLARRVGESIHDRGNRGPLRTFASAERLLSWTVDKLDLNVRHVAHCQDRIALPITRGDPIAVEVDLLV